MDHLATLGAAPAVTAYAPDGRLEISGRVARQWASKIGGLLRDELDAEPGDVLAVDLPPSWRAPVWTLGALVVGLAPRLPEESGTRPDGTGALPDGPGAAVGAPLATVTHEPSAAGVDAGSVLALAEASMSMRWTGDLPQGALDASSETLAQPDELILAPEPAEDDPVLRAASAARQELAAGARTAFVPTGTADAVTWVLASWLTGGSAVLLPTGTSEVEAARLADAERAGVRAAH